MTKRPTYRVDAHRSGGWWSLEVPEVRGALTQCRRLDEADEVIRDAISAVLDLPDDAFDLSINVNSD